MTRQAISDLENGRRRYVTTAELVILSQALNTPPVCLVYPGPYEEAVEVLPGHEVAQFDAAQWFSGLPLSPAPLVESQGVLVDLMFYSDASEKLETWRQLSELEDIRTSTMIVSDEDRKSLLLYDKQIAILRKRLGIGAGGRRLLRDDDDEDQADA